MLYSFPAPLRFADFLTEDFFFAAFVNDFLAALFGLFLVTAFFSAAAFLAGDLFLLVAFRLSVLAVLAYRRQRRRRATLHLRILPSPYRRFYLLGLGRHFAQRLRSSFLPCPISQS